MEEGFSREEFGKLKLFLYRDCNPRRFINEAEKLFKKSNNIKIKYRIGCNLHSAYISLGEYDKALEILDSLDKLKFKGNNKNNYYFNILYLKLVTFIIKNDYNNALEYYNKTKPLIDSINAKPKGIEKIKRNFSFIEKRMQYINNELEDLDELIKEIDENQKNNLNKVMAMSFLSELYLKKGDKEKAKEYLEKVITLGNQTIYVEKAQVMLAEDF